LALVSLRILWRCDLVAVVTKFDATYAMVSCPNVPQPRVLGRVVRKRSEMDVWLFMMR
jgi:hypothetical protein